MEKIYTNIKTTDSKFSYINSGLSRIQSKENYQRQRGTLCNDKRDNPPHRHSIPDCVFIKQQSYKVFQIHLIGIKGEMDIKIVGDFIISLSTIDRSASQKVSKDAVELNNTINKHL